MKIIPLDINKIEYPIEVFHSKLARQISDMCKDWKIPIPDEMRDFVNKQDLDAGYDWENRLVVEAKNMSEELLLLWISSLSNFGIGTARGDLRAILKQRQ